MLIISNIIHSLLHFLSLSFTFFENTIEQLVAWKSVFIYQITFIIQHVHCVPQSLILHLLQALHWRLPNAKAVREKFLYIRKRRLTSSWSRHRNRSIRGYRHIWYWNNKWEGFLPLDCCIKYISYPYGGTRHRSIMVIETDLYNYALYWPSLYIYLGVNENIYYIPVDLFKGKKYIGVLQNYYEQNEFGGNSDNLPLQLSFAPTIYNILINILGPMSQLLLKILGPRNTLFVSVVIASLGLFSASFSTRVQTLFLDLWKSINFFTGMASVLDSWCGLWYWHINHVLCKSMNDRGVCIYAYCFSLFRLRLVFYLNIL